MTLRTSLTLHAIFGVALLAAAAGCPTIEPRDKEPESPYTKPDRIRENVLKLGEDVSPAVLQEVIRQLRLAGRKAEPMLIEALDEENPRLRSNAVFVLGMSTNPDIIKHIDQLLKDPVQEVRLEASAAMLQQGYRDGIPFQIAALRHANPTVRTRAFRNLFYFTGGLTMGYRPDAPKDRREFSVKKWEAWWNDNSGTFVPHAGPR